MKKGFCFEIQGMINVFFRGIQTGRVTVKYIPENIPRPEMRYVFFDRTKNILDQVLGYKSLPELIVLINIIFKVIVNDSAIISPV